MNDKLMAEIAYAYHKLQEMVTREPILALEYADMLSSLAHQLGNELYKQSRVSGEVK